MFFHKNFKKWRVHADRAGPGLSENCRNCDFGLIFDRFMAEILLGFLMKKRFFQQKVFRRQCLICGPELGLLSLVLEQCLP